MATLSDTSRSPIVEPDFVAGPVKFDSSNSSQQAGYFYRYVYYSREDDRSMTPEWALANLYHGGITVIEAWYAESTTPSSHGHAITGTLYAPFFVVRLATEDSYMDQYHYRRLESFDPVKASKSFRDRLTHYEYK